MEGKYCAACNSIVRNVVKTRLNHTLCRKCIDSVVTNSTLFIAIEKIMSRNLTAVHKLEKINNILEDIK